MTKIEVLADAIAQNIFSRVHERTMTGSPTILIDPRCREEVIKEWTEIARKHIEQAVGEG